MTIDCKVLMIEENTIHTCADCAEDVVETTVRFVVVDRLPDCFEPAENVRVFDAKRIAPSVLGPDGPCSFEMELCG